jgi:hypothetical protein
MFMSLTEFAQLLYDSEIGTALRESIYAFPIVEGLHLIGLAFSVGLLFVVDFRLLGWFLPDIAIEDLLKPLRPWILSGFFLTLLTGLLLFVSSAVKVITLSVFYYKLLFIALAGINAVWFEIKWGRQLSTWDGQIIFPAGVRWAGSLSLVFWSLVIITGRLIPYLSYE